MKKKVFFYAAAAIALASCSNDEIVEQNLGNGINFRTSVQTRATETNEANLSEFSVTAINGNSVYFENVAFAKKDGVFSPKEDGKVYYWPTGGVLDFYAYSPAADKLGDITISSAGAELTDFAPASVVKDQVDFITATAFNQSEKSGEGDNTASVQLDFGHRLTQVVVMAKNSKADAETGYTYKVKGVRIAKAVSKGSYDLKDNKWQLGSDKVNYEVTYEAELTLSDEAQTIMGDGEAAMLLPQDLSGWDHTAQTYDGGSYLGVLVNITTKAGKQVYPYKEGEYGWVAVPVATKWVMGKMYVYTLNFAGGAGKVDPEKPGKGEEGNDPDDPFTPGADIVGGPITFTAKVAEWGTDENFNPDVNMVE